MLGKDDVCLAHAANGGHFDPYLGAREPRWTT
jgi:hypothetical protein